MATITTRVDDSIKEDFLIFCDSVGLTASALFNMFAKACIREQKVPFEIQALNYEARRVKNILDEGHQRLRHIAYESDETIADEITRDRRERFGYGNAKDLA